jgi:4-amino-4-deoxy-L-arabinose transferase-like glycosyltransferase
MARHEGMLRLKRHLPVVVVILLMIVHAGLSLSSMRQISATYDEPDYVGAGRYLLETGNWRMTPAIFHPPIAYYLQALPLLFADLPDASWSPEPADPGKWVWYDVEIGNRLLFDNPEFGREVLFRARCVTVALSLVLLLVIAAWTKDLFGWPGGLLAGTLYALSPNILADARLVTTDIPFALFFTAQFFSLWWLRKKFSWGRLLACSAIAGGTLGAKFNGIFALPAGLVLLIVTLRACGIRCWRKTLGCLAVYIAIPFIVLWALYGFHVAPPRDPDRSGHVVELVSNRLPAPLGRMFVAALDRPWLMPQYIRLAGTINAYSHRGIPGFLLGEFRDTGWWYYFPVAFLVKTPIPVMLLGLSGMAALIMNARNRPEAIYVALPMLVIMAPAILGPLNIGIRHILPVYPLLFLLAGSVAQMAMPRGKAILAVLVAWLAISTANTFPSYLSYFNEIAGGNAGGDEWLSDSNIGWGEDFLRLAQFQKDQKIDTIALAWFTPNPPEAFGVRYRELDGPVIGWVAVETMREQFSRTSDPNPLEWLSARKPYARLGGIKVYYSDSTP